MPVSHQSQESEGSTCTDQGSSITVINLNRKVEQDISDLEGSTEHKDTYSAWY